MDELLSEFLTETGERLDELDVNLVRFEQEPNDAQMLNAIFRLVHTVKGTCGFLGLNRLAQLAHAAETLMGQYRDGAAVTVEGVSVILASIDRIKEILAGLERDETEPPGSDDDLITALQSLAEASALAQVGGDSGEAEEKSWSPVETGGAGNAPPIHATLEELERAWREAPGPDPVLARKPERPLLAAEDDHAVENGVKELITRTQTVRVSVDTLEYLMTTVSELVLTRNQLLDLVRRTDESEFKNSLAAALQRDRGAAGRDHEGPHAAGGQRLAEAAAAGA